MNTVFITPDSTQSAHSGTYDAPALLVGDTALVFARDPRVALQQLRHFRGEIALLERECMRKMPVDANAAATGLVRSIEDALGGGRRA